LEDREMSARSISLRAVSKRPVTSRIDGDTIFTLGLTLVVSLLSLGAANLFALHRVVSAARVRVDPRDTSPLVLVPGKRLIDQRLDLDFELRLRRAAALSSLVRESLFYLWFVVGKGWATLTCNTLMLARVT
jgi:hypothetical protein